MNIDKKGSCESFMSDFSTSSESVPFPCTTQPENPPEEPLVEIPSCSKFLSSSTSSSLSTMSSGYFKTDCRALKFEVKPPPNLSYEADIAKSILQKYSTKTGNNLFDHLSNIIKHVIDERPENVIDYFEEYSRMVRRSQFHVPERFPPDAIYLEKQIYPLARKFLYSMKLPMLEEHQERAAPEGLEEDNKSIDQDMLNLKIDEFSKIFITFNERVQQLQFYWNQCGFSIGNDDIFQLACAMTRLQTHPSIQQCRFWGMITGYKASYYIVEAYLTQEEINSRIIQMKEEMQDKLSLFYKNALEPQPVINKMGLKLIPGGEGWEHVPPEEIANMKPAAKPLPQHRVEEDFDVPPELIGEGANRFSYFVVNSLSDDWIELPIVTPKQIKNSRLIKKMFSGDLEEDVKCYPEFCGKEKHLLRAVIGRITAGTYIAPRGYYRRMTKKEKRLFLGIEDDGEEEEEEEEEFGEEEEEEFDNDVFLIKNEKYEPQPLNTMSSPSKWVHVRPNLLMQGRVVWFDEERARRLRAKQLARLARLAALEEMEEEFEDEEEEEEGEEEGLEEETYPDLREYGPNILTPCDEDYSPLKIVPWICRYSSKYSNEKERVLIMRSSIWPGAFTFTFENVCESIYLGWGHKYVARNMPFEHMPAHEKEYPHGVMDFLEIDDPSVEDELAYELAMRKKLQHDDLIVEEEGVYTDDMDEVTENDDDDEEEE